MDGYQSQGHRKAAVLLIHGQPGSPADWRFVASELEPSVSAVVPERPGYGANPLPAGGFQANAQAMIDVLDRAHIDKAVVVGHSWGGAVALEMALSYPERVTGVVLVSSVGPGAVTLTDRVLALPGLSRLTATLAVRLGGAALSPRVSGPVSRLLGVRLRNAGQSLIHRDRHKRLAATYVVEQQALINELPGLSERISSLTVPVSILHARNDRFVTMRVARSLNALIPGSKLRESPSGAHYLPHRRPEVVVSAINLILDNAEK